jgi:hypothetical protein
MFRWLAVLDGVEAFSNLAGLRFYLLRSLHPRSPRIGPEIKDEATDTNSESSQRIFQRHQGSHAEKA